MSGALDGVRVVDLTTVLMGPFATQMLGDLGADVIKVEPPGGDSTRALGPARHPGMSASFLHTNRNKRSLVLDLKQPAAHAALLKLIATADVLVYNVRPQAMARLGLTWDTLCAINPRLVYVGCFGYGQHGPYAAKPAYDDLIQGALGLPSLVARVGDGVPRYVPIAMIDRTVGMAAVNAVCAALYRREKTGVGQGGGRADVRNDGALHARRASGRRDLRTARGRARLSAHAGPRAHAVSDAGRLCLHADLHRSALAPLLRDDRPRRRFRPRPAPRHGSPRARPTSPSSTAWSPTSSARAAPPSG